MLYRYAMRLLGNQQVVEECISDTFLRFLKSLRNSQGPVDHLKSYLYRIAHNWIIDYYRHSKMDPDELTDEIPEKTSTVEEQAHQNILISKARKALLHLRWNKQQIIS
jgi:RNA polymerase sigma-70 factor (ECF subfamily)